MRTQDIEYRADRARLVGQYAVDFISPASTSSARSAAWMSFIYPIAARPRPCRISYRGKSPGCSKPFSTTLPQHRAGKVRILAYAYPSRAAIAPEIPTMIEAGVKDYEAYTFSLILGPAGMPQPAVDTIDQASRKLMAATPTW